MSTLATVGKLFVSGLLAIVVMATGASFNADVWRLAGGQASVLAAGAARVSPQANALPRELRPLAVDIWSRMHSAAYADKLRAEPEFNYFDYRGFRHDRGRLTLDFGSFELSASKVSGPIESAGDAPDALGFPTRTMGKTDRAGSRSGGGFVLGTPRVVPDYDGPGEAVEVDLFWSGDAPTPAGDLCRVALTTPAGEVVAERGNLWVGGPLSEGGRDSVIYAELEGDAPSDVLPEVSCDAYEGPGFVPTTDPSATRAAPSNTDRMPYGENTAWVNGAVEWEGPPAATLTKCVGEIRGGSDHSVARGFTVLHGARLASRPRRYLVNIPVERGSSLEGTRASISCSLIHELDDAYVQHENGRDLGRKHPQG